MKNLSIWAWMPEDYNPQGKHLSFMQIRQQVQFFGFEPKSLGMATPLGNFCLQISEWARDEQRNGNKDEALDSYKELETKAEKRGCFYIEYLPDDNFHEFHAMLIEKATGKGLIVLSDFSEAVFYPDGTSEPAMAFQAIQESREEEIQAKINAYGSSLEDFLTGYNEVETKESAKIFTQVILKEYLDKEGVQYKITKDRVDIYWYDCVITIYLHVTHYATVGFVIQGADTLISPNKSYEKDFLTYKNTSDGWVKEFTKKTESLRYNWQGLDINLENPKFVDIRCEGNQIFKTYKLHKNQIFYEYICLHLDTLFNFLNGKQSFFDIIDQIYQDKSGILNPFRVFRDTELKDLPNDDMTANAVINNLDDELSLLYLVNHPQTWNYFNQIKETYSNYISQQSSTIQDNWGKFIQRMTEQLNHGLKLNTNSQ